MVESQEQVSAQSSDVEEKLNEQVVRRPLLSWPKAGRSVRARARTMGHVASLLEGVVRAAPTSLSAMHA